MDDSLEFLYRTGFFFVISKIETINILFEDVRKSNEIIFDFIL